MPPVIQITSNPSFRELSHRARKANKRMDEGRREMMRKIGRTVIFYERLEAPERTGKFKKSLIYRTAQSGATITLKTFSAQPLGKWIIGGTRPHIIRAKRVKFLRFFWPKGPNGPGVYFFRSVNHPGTKPNPYHERAWRRAQPEAVVELRKLGGRFVADLSGGAQ